MHITTNENKELVTKLRERIHINLGHCPNAEDFTKGETCMCSEAKRMIANEIEGYCPCGLYKFEKEKK